MYEQILMSSSITSEFEFKDFMSSILSLVHKSNRIALNCYYHIINIAMYTPMLKLLYRHKVKSLSNKPA